MQGGGGVLLNSLGGNVVEALAIGQAIRNAGLDTAILNQAVCASACALIWLAGINRYLAPEGLVGFHAAYSGSGDDARENGAANALVGAYLTKLGLPYEAVVYVTSAAPNDIQWLSFDDARKVGITMFAHSGRS